MANSAPHIRSLPGSGTIKQSQVKAEFNKGNNLRAYLGAAPGVPSSGNLKLTDFYGKTADNSLSDYITDGRNGTYIFGGSYFAPSSDANIGKTDPTANGQTMYWNKGDQPFDGTESGSFADGNDGNMGILYRRFSGADNQGGVRSGGYGNESFGIYAGEDNYYKSIGSAVWCFPWQKITKGPHTFSGQYYQNTAGYPDNDYNELVLFLVEFDTWSLDPSNPNRGILSNRVARTQVYGKGITYPTQATNWNAQFWNHSRTTVGRYLCLEFQSYCSPQHYTKHYITCRVT